MKKAYLSLMAAALLLPATPALADSSIKNETSDYQFVEISCPSTSYTKQVDPGRRVVVTTSEFNGSSCVLEVEGQNQKYRLKDHNNYQINTNSVTKTAG
jgi:hypothetical protein